MTDFLLGVSLGVVIGNFFGVIVAGIMNASYEADRQREGSNADDADR